MENILNAARSGDVQMLHQLLTETPSLLSTYIQYNSSDENPLSVAIEANQLVFAREILQLNPEIGLKLDQNGIRPLDAASARGDVEIVKMILESSGQRSCQSKGKDGWTAIHYAAMHGRTEVINELLSVCSDCVNDVTSFGETVLHLAVKFFQFEVLKCLLEWLEILGKVDLVKMEDWEGNTVLHCAASTKQFESVKLLLEWNKKPGINWRLVHAMNKKGLTPTNIADIKLDSVTDFRLRDILVCYGGISGSHFRAVTEKPEPDSSHVTTSDSTEQSLNSTSPAILVPKLELRYQKSNPLNQGTLEKERETILIIVALVATVTFQAGVTPPSHLSGTASTVFMALNSLALSGAATTIEYLTIGLHFRNQCLWSISAMMLAYVCAILSVISSKLQHVAIVYVALFTPFVMRFIQRVLIEWHIYQESYKRRSEG